MSRVDRRTLVIACGLLLLTFLSGCANHSNHSGSGPTTRVTSPTATSIVGLGDSVVAGTACDCADPVTGYATAMRARSGHRITSINLGNGGGTTSSLLNSLPDSRVQQDLARARVVLVLVGANDLYPQLRQWRRGGCPASCYQPAVAVVKKRLDRILAIIDTARSASAGPVLVADYWNIFEDGEVAREDGGQSQIDWSRRVTRALNRVICAAARRAHDTCVDTYEPIVGGDSDPSSLLADDGDHLNAQGVALLVRQLAAATPKGTFS